MKRFVWLSYDVGVQGDYEGLYLWLDKQKAKECGASVACFSYEHTGDLLQSLIKDLKKNIKVTTRSRFYVMYLGKDKRMKGQFIMGSRKSAPWIGYADFHEGESDSSDA